MKFYVSLPADLVGFGLPDQITSEYLGTAYPWDGKYAKQHYAVTVPGIEKPFDFYSGVKDSEINFSESDAMSFLGCIFLDADCGSMSFSDFCCEFGYDSDSRKAYATWEACQLVYATIANFLTADQIDQVREHLQESGY